MPPTQMAEPLLIFSLKLRSHGEKPYGQQLGIQVEGVEMTPTFFNFMLQSCSS
jgi:hypothetical protein